MRRLTTEAPVGYSVRYAAAWAGWIGVTLAAELLGVGWLWAVALAWFALAEGLAVKRGAKGDTWSELVWAFFSGQPARVALIVGWVGWIGFRLLGFAAVPVTVWGLDAARLCLVGGLCVWLLTHFLARGRFG